MFSIKVKARPIKGRSKEVRLELVFFKTGFPRVPKVFNIIGEAKRWDSASQLFKGNDSLTAQKNELILKEKKKYLDVAELWESEKINWTPKLWSHCFDVEAEVKSNDSPTVSVVEVIDSMILLFKTKRRVKNSVVVTSSNNAENYLWMKRAFMEFTLRKYSKKFSSFYFHHITEKFLSDFVNYTLRRAKLKNANSQGGLPHKLGLLRAVFRYAYKRNMYGVNLGVFDSVQEYMQEKQPEPKTISPKSIVRIENMSRRDFTPKECFYIDLFLFSYYTGGMANVDVCHLTKDCIKENQIIYERRKVNKKATPFLTDKARIIINKYKDEALGDYVFPIFKIKHNTEEKKHMRVKVISMNVNKTLKKVREKLKIKDEITWYSARGTFISKMIDEGFHPMQVAQFAGNSPDMIYRHYYKNTDPKSTLENLNRIF